jgi:hypothetical protein
MTKAVTLTREQAHAVKALKEGRATPEQQIAAFEWAVYYAAGLSVPQFVEGGEDGRRGTDFMTGRAFTGQQLLAVAMTDMNVLFPEKTKDTK